ncbi:MAG: hypothetical protein J6Y58_11205 [Clostridiales bacterium]|nr:hypothetical protein [Clostridiales bacterium]
MAYVDQNGLIMIEEMEAAADVKKLNAAKDSLVETLAVLNNIAGINSAFKGEAATTIETTVLELIKKVEGQKAAIENEINYINQVVEKYKVIDANMKNQINSALT